MTEPTVRVTLTREDINFINDSIGQNVPSDEEKTEAELATTDKLRNANGRLMDKEKEFWG